MWSFPLHISTLALWQYLDVHSPGSAGTWSSPEEKKKRMQRDHPTTLDRELNIVALCFFGIGCSHRHRNYLEGPSLTLNGSTSRMAGRAPRNAEARNSSAGGVDPRMGQDGEKTPESDDKVGAGDGGGSRVHQSDGEGEDPRRFHQPCAGDGASRKE